MRLRQEVAQVGAERAQDAALDHMQAPQQQGDAAHQVEENNRAHHASLATPAEFRFRILVNPSQGKSG